MESNMAKKNTTPTSNLSADKAKAVEAAIAQIEKNYGKGSIMALGSQPVEEIPVIPTGCIQLDMALGVGGFPRGRIIEIYGPESSGKTTLTLHAIAEAQKLGGVAAFIDAEHAFDAVYARKLGVDIESLLVSQPDTGEQALDIAETLVRSGAIDIIVIDSVAALVPQAEINGEMGDNHVGLQARLMSQALRKLTGILSKSNTCMLFINQLRMKIGVMFGKVAAPFTQCEFDILYGCGISREASILDLATELDIIQKSGSWFSYNNERIGQGRENTRLFLKDNPELCSEIEQKIRESMKDVELFKLGENEALEIEDDGEGAAVEADA